jgi:hypothetical protein
VPKVLVGKGEVDFQHGTGVEGSSDPVDFLLYML